MVDVTPGDSGANKGFWRKQLRDRYGRFVEMGGSVLFELDLPGVSGTVHATGNFIGMLDLETARIQVPDDSRVPKGVYLIKSDKITAVKAKLPKSYVDKKLQENKGQGAPNYEGTDGVALPGKWREHAIGEDDTRTRKDNPGLKWDRYTAVVPVSEVSKFAEFDRNTQEKFSDSKDIIDSIAEELREGGVEALKDALWIKYDPKNKWGVLVEGNHRLAAAVKAGITEIPVSITTGADLADNKNKNIGSRLDIDNRIVETTGYMPSDVHPGNFKQFEGYR